MAENLTGSAPFQPDPRFDRPETLNRTLQTRVLSLVSSPARYLGGELGARREGFAPDRANILLAFPDAYEIGMSHLGLRVLYSALQRRADTFCDLVFTPLPDLETIMRELGLPLFGLQCRRPARQFDVIGFSLGYELAYTNMLTMIDLAGSPLLADDRSASDPIFIAGGSCTLNPAVIGPFLDLVLPGDGEESSQEVARIIAAGKAEGQGRQEILAELRDLPGVWHPDVAKPVKAWVLSDLDALPCPDELVPLVEPVHDRLALEVMRGCTRGCRFCQAGMITRPVRERNPEALVAAAERGLRTTGYGEVSLLSLSSSDYGGLAAVVAGIQDGWEGSEVNLVLPSLRMDAVEPEVLERIGRRRPTSLTFAPETGTQRLRDVINKQISQDDILAAVEHAFAVGVKTVKLYFMIGLPTETDLDLEGIVDLVGQVVKSAPGGGGQVHVSISPFAPKAHTPFQWAGQISRQEMQRRNAFLAGRLRPMGVKTSLREPEVSYLEGLLGLGDASLAGVVQEVWRQGARFDAWTEHFDFSLWAEALSGCGVDTQALLAPRDPDLPLPWDQIDAGVTREFLGQEWIAAQAGHTLADCRPPGACHVCGVCGPELAPQLVEFGPVSQKSGAEPGRGGAKEQPSFDARNADPADADREARKWEIWRQQAAAKCWYRVEFCKQGDMIWLGHLDFQRQLQLALRRSGLPVAYSRGYHPHPLLKFGPSLPVGIAGLRECLDIAMEYQVPGWADVFNSYLPDGLKVLQAVVVGSQTPPSIDAAVGRFDYRAVLPAAGAGGPAYGTAAAIVAAFHDSSHWACVRHRPKGSIEIDARPLVPTGGLGLQTDNGGETGCVLEFSLLKSDSGTTLPAHDFLAALFAEALPEARHCAVSRTGYCGSQPDGRWLAPIKEVGETSRRFWLLRHMAG